MKRFATLLLSLFLSFVAAGTARADKIAFDSLRGRNWKIYVMNADGTSQTPLNFGYFGSSPKFSPDGKRITFLGSEEISPWQGIYLANADGTGAKWLATIFDTEFLPEGDPCIAPDGTQIAFTSGNGSADIYRINADGKGQIQLTKGELHTGQHIYPKNFSPSFSPDGKQIVFVSDRYSPGLESNNEIYVMNADGSNQTRITHNDDDDGAPCFSPDGKHIAFESVREGKRQIWLMKADGSDVIQLTRDNGISPCFSPDGKHIAYASHGIMVINIDGSHPIRLTQGETDFSPTWAPGFVPAPAKNPKK